MYSFSVLEWSDTFRTHIPKIDAEHKHLAASFNNLSHCLLDIDCCVKIKGNALQIYCDQTRTHFTNEEWYMQEIGFDDYEVHKERHNIFLSRLDCICKDFWKNGEISNTDLSFMVAWLAHHICITDKAIGTFVLNLRQ